MNFFKVIIVSFVLFLITFPLNADYKDVEKDFAAYRNKIEKDYSRYKKIMDEEFLKYKKEISKIWGDSVTSTDKSWIEYSGDFKIKRELNFEDLFIKISFITEDKSIPEKSIRLQIEDMLLENGEMAVKRNVFLRSVEKRLRSSGMDVLHSDSMDKTKVIGDVLTGEKKPDIGKIKNTAFDLLKKGKVKVSHPDLNGKRVVSVTIALPEDTLKRKASVYRHDVQIYSAERRLNPSLVFSVIHTESTFNPMARSNIPAYGLMQVVPQTAGIDATRLLYGREVILAPSYLYNPRNNIKIGVAYISILYKKYMRRIKDPKSRMYCVIAAYNTGASNVGRAFIGKASMQKAVPVVNSLSPEKVYEKLVTGLPKRETRNYLKKVIRRMNYYKEE